MAFCFNRRGQVDKIITFLPVFILIFLLIAGFIVFSALISKSGKGFGEAKSVQDVGNLLFEQISIKNSEGVLNLRVINALNLKLGLIDGTVKDSRFSNFQLTQSIRLALVSLLNENKNCIFLYSSSQSFGEYLLRYNPKGNLISGSIDVRADDLSGVQNINPSATGIQNPTLTKQYEDEGLVNTFVFQRANGPASVSYYYGRCLE
jgi:hypothetical protein